VKRSIAIHKYTSFNEALELQIPILSFFKKWMPYDRLAFVNDRWGEVFHYIPRGKIVHWPPLIVEKEGIALLTLP